MIEATPNLLLVLTQFFILSLSYAETKATEQRLAAEKIALENLSQVKTGFLQDIKHEIRNPLHVISLGVDYVKIYFEPKGNVEKAEKVLATMQNEALRLGRMVEGMVELATTEGSKSSRQKLDFAALIASCAENYKLQLANHQNVLQVKVSDALPFVYAESEQLERVIINLLSNANDSVTDGEISIEVSAESGYIIVHIRDKGSGIAPELMPRIFERGVSGKGQDGYGLAICKTIVEAHGGAVGIESGGLQVDSGEAEVVAAPASIEGTVVTFTIPVYGGQGNGERGNDG